MAEHLATRVCHQFQIDPLKLVWIEHYPERGGEWRSTPIKESWDFVTFQQIAESDWYIVIHKEGRKGWRMLPSIEHMNAHRALRKSAQGVY